MDLLERFFENTKYDLNRKVEVVDIAHTVDDFEFVYVDGEEGDYGVIKYLDATGQVIAIRTIEGGDTEHTDFTEYGLSLMKIHMREVLDAWLDEACAPPRSLPSPT